MKKSIVILGLIGALAICESAGAEYMSHWANIRDKEYDIIGKVDKGEYVQVLGKDETDSNRTMILYNDITGSVMTEYISGSPVEKDADSEQEEDLENTREEASDGWNTDGASNTASSYRIEISIADQCLYLYQDGDLIFATECVTGTEGERDTPVGEFSILDKVENTVLNGEDFSRSIKYWMPIYMNVGIHDAYWREDFGGDIYTYDGSHGCVNLSLSAAEYLFDVVSVGTPVTVY